MAAYQIDRFKEVFREGMKEAMKDVVCDENVWRTIDAAIQKDLEKSSCWLSFHDDQPTALIGIGEGDVAHHLTAEISIEDYGDIGGAVSEGQLGDIREQITGIDKFVTQLGKAKATLEKALKAGVRERK